MTLQERLAQDREVSPWSIHLDEVEEWNPREQSFSGWFGETCRILALARRIAGTEAVVAAVLSLEPSEELQLFKDPIALQVDFLTPPLLYVLDGPLEFLPAAEQYFRVLVPGDVGHAECSDTLLAMSTRTCRALESRWAFDNSLYVSTHFSSVDQGHIDP